MKPQAQVLSKSKDVGKRRLHRLVSQQRAAESLWLEQRHATNFQMGKLIREIREQHGISLRELARRIGVSAAYVSDMELGRRGPCLNTVEKIAKALAG